MFSNSKRASKRQPFRMTFRGTYTDGSGIYDTLRRIIPQADGEIFITYERGRYHCILPRPLSEWEEKAARQTIDEGEHYERIPR